MQSNSRAFSIIVYCADQSAFGLPQFTTSTKDIWGPSLIVQLIGVLEHCALKAQSISVYLNRRIPNWCKWCDRINSSTYYLLQGNPYGAKENISLNGQLYLPKQKRDVYDETECHLAWGVFGESYISFLPLDIHMKTLTNNFHPPPAVFEQNMMLL